MNKIAVYLNRHLTGSVFDKDSILEAYSTDRSLLKIKPRLVALPESTADIRKLVRFASQLSEKDYNLPIAVRGSGLSKTGADLSNGMVISMEKLNHVKELDPHDRLVHVQAGISLGKLNAVLAPHGLTLPVSANPNETIGSLIANATRDNYSKRYGGIMNYVNRAEIVLSNGELIQTSQLKPGKLAAEKNLHSLEGEIYDKLDRLLVSHKKQVAALSDSSRLGYPALKYIRRDNGHVFDLLPTFFGSEGTLGIITEVILRVEVLPPKQHRFIAAFSTIKAAQEFMSFAEKLMPLTIELFDTEIFRQASEYGKLSEILPKKIEKGYLVLVAFNDKVKKTLRKIKKCEQFLPESTYHVAETTKNSTGFDSLKSCLITYLNGSPDGERPNLLHDFYIPNKHLEEFTSDLHRIGATYAKTLELYGCYSTSVYSTRPEFDLSEVNERRTAIGILQDINELLKYYGGSLTGGLPEGKLKSILLYPELEDKDKELFEEVKRIFDKVDIFSPETKTTYNARSTIHHLRTEPNKQIDS